jgi:16S rRNA (cytosine1402-N4)-methyltransferase
MADTALAWLRVRAGGTYVDCTAGAGGHSALIAGRLEGGRLLALDRDPEAVARAAKRLAPFAGAQVRRANYADLAAVCAAAGIRAADGVLLDAGVSSMQLDKADRGFSFQAEGPLDMRMDPDSSVTAADWLRTVPETELAATLRRLGDVGPAKRIARAVSKAAADGALATTRDLRDAVHDALGMPRARPRELQETRQVFQAVRIAVNDELGALTTAVAQAVDLLAPGGRLVVIAFHSGEDRIVKDALRAASRPARTFRPDGRLETERPPRLRVLTKKPVQAGEDECRRNPRANSARLRAAEKLEATP